MSTPYSGPQTAFRALGDALLMVRNAEARHADAQRVEEKASLEVERAQKKFNEVRDQVIAEYPEILEGYSKETVKMVDGKIQVVET